MYFINNTFGILSMIIKDNYIFFLDLYALYVCTTIFISLVILAINFCYYFIANIL